jgi:hypothetical protein
VLSSFLLHIASTTTSKLLHPTAAGRYVPYFYCLSFSHSDPAHSMHDRAIKAALSLEGEARAALGPEPSLPEEPQPGSAILPSDPEVRHRHQNCYRRYCTYHYYLCCCYYCYCFPH